MGTLVGMLLVGVTYILQAYTWMMIAAWLLQLARADPNIPLIRGLYAITDPLPRRVRQKFPKVVIATGSGYLDLSGLIVLIGIQAIIQMLTYLRLHVV